MAFKVLVSFKSVLGQIGRISDRWVISNGLVILGYCSRGDDDDRRDADRSGGLNGGRGGVGFGAVFVRFRGPGHQGGYPFPWQFFKGVLTLIGFKEASWGDSK